MALGDAAVGHAVNAVDVLHAVVLRIGREAAATAFDEAERPVEFITAKCAEGPGRTHLVEHRVGGKTAAEGHRHQVLHQHVERLVGRRTLLDAPGQRGAAGGGGLDQLQRVGRHQRDAAGPSRRMAAAAGALQQPRDAFRAADLQHPFDRQEIDTEVQRRGADHRLQLPLLQPGLDPFAHRLVE